MKKITFITFSVLLTMAFSAFAQAVPTPTEYLILTSQASQRAADSTRAARLADTLSDHTTQLDLKATAAAVVILQATADECSTEANNAAASAALAYARADSGVGYAISMLDTATNLQNNLAIVQATADVCSAATDAVEGNIAILQATADVCSSATDALEGNLAIVQTTANACSTAVSTTLPATIQAVREADSTSLARLADTLGAHTTTMDVISGYANDAKTSSATAVSDLATADSLFGVKRAADSTAFAANVTAVAALPTTTHITNVQSDMSSFRAADSARVVANTTAIGLLPSTTVTTNIANQITAVDAIVDTILAAHEFVFRKTAIAQTVTSTDSIAICTVNNGCVEIEAIYLEVTTEYEAVTDSVRFIIDYPGGYTTRLDCGEVLNAAAVGTKFMVAAVAAGTATTKTLVGVPFALTNLKMNLSTGTAITLLDVGTGTQGRAKVLIKYRPIDAGARLD
jgi:hypothetical protein